ncbi:gephyrin-like molybdotransferase Glp [Zavarzinia compransoris]|uniref:Molybdopterin molybdenumtransferase n=1 Tax=Zavarzinia compransoris TaxID=1264899 RepID=A0A317ED89_9PROT|nr:gephyrin-like molybdotransferase Glp [Zavarzinia compransoris]PWR24110.1 molybdopterin molybdenumtransferase MoeA [Zavarzinia compransoris]TDP48056.1 molybdopterin molybdochelatase [Zavarzinia compransoris]
MIPVAEARARIVAALAPTGPENIGLDAALGRVLAADVAARRTQPPVAVSAMDGWAVRSADGAGPLRAIGESAAGRGFAGAVAPGETVRIFTGAPVPAGADAVAIQEDARHEGDLVHLADVPGPGRFVRPAGLDFATGDLLYSAPRRLGVRDIGLLAAADVPRIDVHRRPRIAVLATGDELVPPGLPRGPAQIVDAARPALLAFIEARGATAVDLGIARDDAADIATRAGRAAGADLLVTLGGASVGDHDLIARVLAGDGATLDFWKIAMRPGKPLMFGRHGDTPLLGLPGNPVSAFVCSLLFLGPAIERLSGLPGAAPRLAEVRLASPLGANDKREDYVRATLAPGADGIPLAQPAPVQDSSQLRTLALADALIQRPVLAPALPAGALVPAILLDQI